MNKNLVLNFQRGFTLAKRTFCTNRQYNQRKCAFTLAEVLITLGIIGVVAAMTMPSLIANHKEKQTVAQLKKTYSILQQAYLMAINKYGDPENWDKSNTYIGKDDEGNNITDYSSAYTIFQYLAENMKSVDGAKANEKVTHEYILYSLDGTQVNSYSLSSDSPNIYLNDGTYILAGYISSNTMDFMVGLNKCVQKGKCVLGKDMFYFNLSFSPAKIIPEGSDKSTTSFKQYCNMNQPHRNNGRACSAWVIYNENMDYLHCNNLDWNKKTKCR